MRQGACPAAIAPMISHMTRSADPMCIRASDLLGLKVAVELAVCDRLAAA